MLRPRLEIPRCPRLPAATHRSGANARPAARAPQTALRPPTPPRSDMNSRRCMCPENTPYAIVVVNILGPRHAPRRQEIYLVRGRAAHHFLHIAEIVKLVE